LGGIAPPDKIGLALFHLRAGRLTIERRSPAMKNSLSILGAALIIGIALYFGLRALKITNECECSGIIEPCSVCGRDIVQSHGRILVKNATRHNVTVYVRHHPKVPPTVLELDPNGFEVIQNVLVGTMMLRAVGEGFDEESHCTILPNTQHEMWWTTRGWEMHGAPQQHM